MLRGSKIGLRARQDDDIPVLQAELYDNDVRNQARCAYPPWRPIRPGTQASPFEVDDDERHAVFSIVELEGGALAGTATLRDIDLHQRNAHLGLQLRPDARGRGYGTDVVAVLCHYGFVVRGLQRIQIETLADNDAMLRSAERNGFVREGLLRSAGWVMGEFVDEIVLGLLAQDWKPAG